MLGRGCIDADVPAAFDDAIRDGVHILSISIGLEPQGFFTNALAIGSFHAVEKGILTVFSAGNDGPAHSLVTNVAPWVLTVVASTIDSFVIDLLGNNITIRGFSLNTYKRGDSWYSLVYGEDIGNESKTKLSPKYVNLFVQELFVALQCFEDMQQQKLLPNKVTFSSVLTACGYLGAVDNGRHIHEQIIVNDLQSDVFVGNGLVDMYTKCGRPEEAQSMFNKLLYRDVVSWNAMLAGYIEHGESMLVLECFNSMQQDGLKPNAITCLSVLKACGSIGAMEKGRYIHEQVIENGLQTDIFVGNTLVDMYVKCGSLREARKVFEELQDHGDVVSWNAIMGGYAEHGKGHLTLECFHDMQQNGVLPDSATFSAILNACRYAGFVEEGQQFLKSMRESHGIIPDMHHNNCMIDVLSREGCLNEAKFLLTQTLQPNTVGWMTLLNACRLHLSVDLGKQCFDEVISLDASCGAAYVLMASIYASNDMLKDMAQLEELVKYAGATKKPGMVSTNL